MELEALGWNDGFEAQRTGAEDGLVPARVTTEDRGLYRVRTGERELLAEVSGRFRNDATARADFPAVGDWVLIRQGAVDSRAVISGRLRRRSRFLRKAAGSRTEAQVVAANVDVVFLVSGLDHDFNLRRIERYVTLVYDGGADPVVVLNKVDLCDDVELSIRQVEGVAFGVPVVPVGAESGEGLDGLLEHLGRGRTGALVGSSGVGKSTIVNRLLDEERLATNEVRESDGRGRHTTTRRELLVLPEDRGLLIDTPGMREVALWAGEDALATGFSDVEEIAAACRFRDCGHTGEPGCAVQRSLGEGTLDVDRLESYLGQQRELGYLARKQDAQLRMLEQDKWKKITMQQRKNRNHRER